MSRVTCDVVVAGGGMAGSIAALALSQSGFSVSVIEPRLAEPLNESDPIGLRVSALSLASRNLLCNLDVWDAIEGVRAASYSAMQVWDDQAELRFEASDIERDSLGFIVENAIVQNAVWSALEQQENVTICCPDTLERYSDDDGAVRVQLASGSFIRCRLIVAADGGRSHVRELAELGHEMHRYDQTALVATLKTTEPHATTAWQRFTPTGPVALLPLSKPNQISCVWSTTQARATALRQSDEREFAAALTQITQHRLGELTLQSEVGAFELRRLDAGRYVAPGVVLVGDAAHIVHPLAGQGANMGLQDVAALVEVLTQARRQSSQIGDLAVLRKYERWRRSENAIMSGALDALHRLFLINDPPVTLLRQMGMRMINRTRLARRLFAGHASGLSERSPSLLRSATDPLAGRLGSTGAVFAPAGGTRNLDFNSKIQHKKQLRNLR